MKKKEIKVEFNEKVATGLSAVIQENNNAQQMLEHAKSQANKAQADMSRLIETIISMGSKLEDVENHSIQVDIDNGCLILAPIEENKD